VGEGWADRWARGGLITSFKIYIFHVKKFTSGEGETSVNHFLVSCFLFQSDGEKRKNSLILTTRIGITNKP
jgi:hypothetical protein